MNFNDTWKVETNYSIFPTNSKQTHIVELLKPYEIELYELNKIFIPSQLLKQTGFERNYVFLRKSLTSIPWVH